MTTRLDTLRKLMDFDGQNARKSFWNNTHADPKRDAHSFEIGAEWQHSRLAPILDRLLECVGALTESHRILEVNFDGGNYALEARRINIEALSNLDHEIEKMETK
jgi:hypothetical protein